MLWLSAALSAIAFSVALTVRGETERVATGEEDVRADYLAKGAIQRAILYMQWGTLQQPSGGPYFVAGQPALQFRFPTGDALVELIPETSKLDLNYARPEILENLMLALGAAPDQAAAIASGIVAWRSPNGGQANASLQSSFQGPHTSFHDVEELLNLPGMTPDFFYGTWVTANDRLVPRIGVRDCVSVFGAVDHFDANTVQPPVLAAVGVPPEGIQALLARRHDAPFLVQQDLADFAGIGSPLANHLGVGFHTLYTIRATARMRRPDGSLSDLRRIVSATVKMLPGGLSENGYHILRWYDRG